MGVDRWLLSLLLGLLLVLPAAAGGRGRHGGDGPLTVLRGSLLAGGEISAPFEAPGSPVGRFSVRSDQRSDLRVDPGSVRIQLPGGNLRATAAAPEEDVLGLVALCELGLGPLLCMPALVPPPRPPFQPLPLRPGPGSGLVNTLLPEQEALLGCGPFFGTTCDEVPLVGDGPLVGGVPRLWLPGSRFGRRDFVWLGPDGQVITVDPGLTTPPFVALPIDLTSELTALSWNAIMALVALSGVEGEPGTEDFDPANPFRTDGCSFATPGLCGNVRAIGALVTEGWRFDTLPDDPRRAGTLWLHEAATAYDVVRARGHLAGLEGGLLYLYGPFASHLDGFASGVGVLVVPPEGATLDASSPLAWQAPGPDRIPGTADDTVVGLAWGAARQGSHGMKEPPGQRGRAGGKVGSGPGRGKALGRSRRP